MTGLSGLARLGTALLLAAVCGGALGMERELKSRPAGTKTFSLVCIGSALVMLTNQYVYLNLAGGTGDSVRMGAQVVSGIGFLGAGTIMVSRNNRVRGLTTAAALWVCAAIGIAIGAGYYAGGVATALFALVASKMSNVFDRIATQNGRYVTLLVEAEDETFTRALVDRIAETGSEVLSANRKDVVRWVSGDDAVVIEVRIGDGLGHRETVEELRSMPGIRYLTEL